MKPLRQQLLRLPRSFTAGFSSQLSVSAKAQSDSIRTRHSTFPLPQLVLCFMEMIIEEGGSIEGGYHN